MRLLALDLKQGAAKLAIENVDDLWHLYNLVRKEDLVYARTTREIKPTKEGGRPVKGERRSLTLGIRVNDVLFDKNSNRLRIRGLAIEAPEKYKGIKGSFHTLSLTTNDTLRLVKQAWKGHELKRIKSACRIKAPPIIIISIDDEEACIGILGHFNVDVKFEERLRLPGKREVDKRRDAVKKYFSKVSHAFQEVWKSTKGRVVIVGPGFIKKDLANYFRDNLRLQPTPNITLAFTGSAGISGINEALRSGVLLRVMKENRVLQEISLVKRFFANLTSDSRTATYGVDEVEKAAVHGAVDTLIVVDIHLRESPEQERWRLEEAIREVEKRRGKLVVISSEHEGGENIMSLGGVAAILRFAI